MNVRGSEQMSERLSVYSVIEFADDGDAEFMSLGHNMTREECDRLMQLIPAVSYSGPRPVKEAYLTTVPTDRVLRRNDEAQSVAMNMDDQPGKP